MRILDEDVEDTIRSIAEEAFVQGYADGYGIEDFGGGIHERVARENFNRWWEKNK
jgi:hypothetical protein